MSTFLFLFLFLFLSSGPAILQDNGAVPAQGSKCKILAGKQLRLRLLRRFMASALLMVSL